MNRIILVLLCVFLFSYAPSAQEKSKYEKFIDETVGSFGAVAEKLNNEYKLGSYDRWDAEQDTGKLVFSNKGLPVIIASFQIAGSYSNVSNTWKWSWANDTVDASVKSEMNKNQRVW